MTDSSRQKEIRAIQNEHKWFYAFILGAIVLGIGVWIGAAVFADDPSGYAMNLVTECLGVAVSVVITVFVIDRINERRAEEREMRILKRRLVREAASQSHDVAITAIAQLHHENWIQGPNGVLAGETLAEANLSGAYFRSANLDNANLRSAKLKKAIFERSSLRGARFDHAKARAATFGESNLQRANLSYARLRYAHLFGVDMSESRLYMAKLGESTFHHVNLFASDLGHATMEKAELLLCDLRGAKLAFAKLQGADLSGCLLEGADLFSAELKDIVLPDRTRGDSDVDMSRFTDPANPEFEATLKSIRAIRREVAYGTFRPFREP